MPEWLQWAIYLAGGTIALQGLVVSYWALFRDRPAGHRRCPKCWYNMDGAAPAADASFTCPECGKQIRSERGLHRTRRRYRRASVGVLMIAIGAAAIWHQSIRRFNWWSPLPTYVIISLAPYADDLPQGYRWEFQSRIMRYEPGLGFGPRALKVPIALTPLNSRLLSQVAFRIVRDQPNHPFRLELIGCLGNPGPDRAAVQSLLLNLVLDRNDGIREYAAKSLLKLESDPIVALQPLMQALSAYPSQSSISGSPEPWRTTVIRVIGSFGPASKPAVPTLIHELSQVSLGRAGMSFGIDGERRAAALQALGRIGPDANSLLPQLRATDAELESYRGDDYEERAAELLISGRCRTEDDARTTLFAHPIWRVRRTAVFGSVLEQELNPKWVPFLLKALNDETTYVRQEAAEMLLRHKAEREAAYRSLLRLHDTDQSDAWTRVQIMWRYELDPTPVLPQLEAERSASSNPVVKQNIGRMIDIVRSGVRPIDGNF